MDPTLLGVIVGSLLSVLGISVTHWFTMRREEKQWQRQQEAEEKKWLREEQKAKKESIRNTYHNCIHALSLLVTVGFSEESVKVTDEERLELHKEAHKWLTLVALHHRNSYGESSDTGFHSRLRRFTETADEYTARSLRDQVIELAMHDIELFPDATIEVTDPTERRIRIRIDQEFRREQFLRGIELPESYEFRIRLEELTLEQRQKLWDIYFDTYKEVPRRFDGLPIPSYNRARKRVALKGGSWGARLNPLTSEPKEILNAWELDYDKALEDAQNECKMDSEAPLD